VLFFGHFQNASDLPWYYIPTWIGITTPVIYSVLFIIGATFILYRLFKHPMMCLYDDKDRQRAVVLGLFLGPVMAVIVLKSVLYDGWRQMYFIYPFFLIVSLHGVEVVKSWIAENTGKGRRLVEIYCLCIITGSLIYTTLTMVEMHPYQNVYFNVLAGRNVEKRFELDYWGLSYRQALEYILRNEKDKEIRIAVANAAAKRSRDILGAEDRKRIRFSSANEAKYFVSNYRFQEDLLKYQKSEFPYENEIYSIRVNGYKIVGVYKLLSKASADMDARRM
jgi:hypothetical protein